MNNWPSAGISSSGSIKMVIAIVEEDVIESTTRDDGPIPILPRLQPWCISGARNFDLKHIAGLRAFQKAVIVIRNVDAPAALAVRVNDARPDSGRNAAQSEAMRDCVMTVAARIGGEQHVPGHNAFGKRTAQRREHLQIAVEIFLQRKFFKRDASE